MQFKCIFSGPNNPTCESDSEISLGLGHTKALDYLVVYSVMGTSGCSTGCHIGNRFDFDNVDLDGTWLLPWSLSLFNLRRRSLSDIKEIIMLIQTDSNMVEKVATSMLVTDAGDEMCCWQFYDDGDGFGHFGHQHLSLNFSTRHQLLKDVNKIFILSPTF